MRMTVRATACVLIAIGAGFAGCGSDDEPKTVTTTVQSTEPATTSATTEATTTTTSEAEQTQQGEIALEVTELTPFQTPSGNIGCYIDPDSARCDIAERDWMAPRPKRCPKEIDAGQGLTLGVGGQAEVVCAGDTVLGVGEKIDYGKVVRAGDIYCTVVESGVTCIDDFSGHGFMISRERYEIF